MKKLLQIQTKLEQVYFEYFTDYLLFSSQYKNLIEKGYLDSFIESNYIDYLYEICKNLYENNIYPNYIILNFIDFVSLLEVRGRQIIDEKNFSIFESKLQEVLENLYNETGRDETEIYYVEYIKRYSNMKDISSVMGVSVETLVFDIQKDFLYLDILMNGSLDKIDLIGDDFPFFLQKLMIDFPEMKDYPYMMNNLKDIAKLKNDKKIEEYYYYLKHSKGKINHIGFNVNTMEVVYCNTLLQKMIFTGKTKEILKEIDPNILFTIPFYQNLCEMFIYYSDTREISMPEKETYQEIIYFMRNYLKEYSGIYKKDFNSLLNNWILLFNSKPKIVSPEFMYATSLSKSEDLSYFNIPLYWIKEKEFTVKANIQMDLAYDIMCYFFGKDNLEKLKENAIYISSTLTYLWNEYPNMFFDPTIYQKTILLLNLAQNKKSWKLKEKLKKLRKE